MRIPQQNVTALRAKASLFKPITEADWKHLPRDTSFAVPTTPTPWGDLPLYAPGTQQFEETVDEAFNAFSGKAHNNGRTIGVNRGFISSELNNAYRQRFGAKPQNRPPTIEEREREIQRRREGISQIVRPHLQEQIQMGKPLNEVLPSVFAPGVADWTGLPITWNTLKGKPVTK
jgi:hypothetical protein